MITHTLSLCINNSSNYLYRYKIIFKTVTLIIINFFERDFILWIDIRFSSYFLSFRNNETIKGRKNSRQMVEWDRDSFILARGFALRKRKCDFICAISGQLKRKRHLVSNFTADHSTRFFCRRLGRIPSWPLAKKRSGIPLSRACSFLPRSKDRGTGFLLYGATHDLAVKIHVSYEAVQHAKKHGLTDNRVSENRSGTNDLLSTRATKFSKWYRFAFQKFPLWFSPPMIIGVC